MKQNKIGIPQGTICSLILTNIVLHKLDLFMEDIKESFNKETISIKNLLYNKLSKNLEKLINTNVKDNNLIKQTIIEKDKLLYSNLINIKLKRILYLRYEDNFVVLVKGSYSECLEIKNKINNFLLDSYSLILNNDNINIQLTKKHFSFLGAYIINKNSLKYITKKLKNGKIISQIELITTLVKALIDLLINKLIKEGLAKRNNLNKIYLKGRTNLFNSSHYDIIKWYNHKINIILSYYTFASNYLKLNWLIWLLHESCALTLANKYKLKTLSKSFNKFGKYLEDPDTKLKLFILNNYKIKNKFNLKTTIDYNIIYNSWSNKLMNTNSICNSSKNIKIHLIKNKII